MAEKLLDEFPEVFLSTDEIKAAVFRGVRQGKFRKIASRLYTRNLKEKPEQLVRRHLWQIVGEYLPHALIADRTAIENAPAKDGSVFLIAERTRDIKLPGITLKVRKGAPAQENDRPFIGTLRLSSTARAWLENMSPSRAREGSVSRTLTQAEIEERLDTLLRRGGEEALNKLRDEARDLAPRLRLKENYKKLDKIIGAFLGTREAQMKTAQGKSRQRAMPFDPDRVKLFAGLHTALREWPPVTRLVKKRTDEGSATLAFYEAYFSNFIEGTEFEVEEAASIVFDGYIPSERPEDAHDVLGTWRLVSDDAEMKKLPRDADSFTALLQSRHAVIMEGRPDKNPGKFKGLANRAGTTVFVAPDLVSGTLEQGFALYQSLESPFARAVFMMFLVSEVHPFTDGNGRIARVMMNAELVSAGEERIVIPTIYRNNYLSSLKAISQNAITPPFIRTLDYAQKWTSAVEWENVKAAQKILQSCNAFLSPAMADEEGIRLKLPE